jgi:hypothetical protein
MSKKAEKLQVAPWLRPAVSIMLRFRMPVKLATMGALLVIPLLVLTYVQVQSLTRDYLTSRDKVIGAEALGMVLDVAMAVQQHRLETRLGAEASAVGGSSQTRERLASATSKLSGFIDAHPALQLASRWNALAVQLDRLTRNTSGNEALALVEAHTQAMEELRKLAYFAAETSKLLLDPVAPTYVLQDLLSDHTVPWIEAVSRTRMAAAVAMQSPDLAANRQSAIMMSALVSSFHGASAARCCAAPGPG